MITTSEVSPSTADRITAATSNSTSGLVNCRRKSARSFRSPLRAGLRSRRMDRRSAACAEVSPAAVASVLARTCSAGTDQNARGVSVM
ncbi:MAG: hypothetical protein QM724_13810 [Flavobacteriales bacterium]